ncbi:DUF3604 domain-containing protein [Thalassotalea sp. PS06]|uniref:DUF3604 domain-containing protein n=1 Tax=Thalassotalea sp. PS06 TaxID=2594005 RepID=UPI00116339E6|nr:DUF3604 domain-containing protein [Thalassotalea sp. PS06]QDP01660.1 DUF3604 domain-containing protein [Thalassotalea sp. PS06]
MKKLTSTLALLALSTSMHTLADETQDGPTVLLWGDTHLHTNLSPDAYVNKNTNVDPDTAYRFAKGMPVMSDDTRAKVRLHTPLDFLAVTDHAEYAGVPKMLWDGDEELANTKTGARYIEMIKNGKGTDVFFELIGDVNASKPNKELHSQRVRDTVWKQIYEAAEKHNEPGKFTTLIGWEWSSLPNGANLHRVVFMPEGGDVAGQFTPYSAFESDRPEDLWNWLEKTAEETGANFVAIPHGSNISNGLMFQNVDSDGNAITAEYAKTRMRWEPVIEITQIKGDSETKGTLSPGDEFADFETYEHLIKTGDGEEEDHGEMDEAANYVRTALMRGMEIEQKVGVNPYKAGVVGSTDAHTGLASAEEDNFWGKFSLDSKPEGKDLEGAPGVTGWDMSASGLAAVWAKENTREAIVDAFKRKEVYGTSGPRIKLRVFAGYEFKDKDAESADLANIGYDKGVPMGSDLPPAGKRDKPQLLIQAVKDPVDANLDRVQVVKGWVDDSGKAQEKVYNIVWSGDRKMASDGSIDAVGNTVDMETGLYTNDIGTEQLTAVWEDKDFDPKERAFYYVRVLQIPTPRHTLYDSIALGKEHPEEYDAVIQERAYSSPIWYTPE